ncbi:MAG: HEPN domain-containing protein [Candidatus Methanomethylicia archaeon]
MSRWITEARRWIADADEDLKVAQDLISSTHYVASCFHSQQAGEKTVKACLYAPGIEAKGHSITGLLRVLNEIYNRSVEELIEDAKLLDKHYSPPRYLNLHPGVESPAYELYTKRDAELCLISAQKILSYMKELLKQLSNT